MAIRSFHSLKALADHFDGVVYKDTDDDSLLVHEVMNNAWHRYAWTHGKREIKFVESLMGGELPLLIQVYPAL
ncbi:MAG: hypothetical protein KDE53_10960 [Caldilineaceae bacterium]|nr:hypothetical protein [Caldilineaceae bacterium]MCB0184795.1 hypothetical protein [Caldilineaceae bacterium]HRW04552.1 hypothetical protein [Caldilineaceae bacterium]